MYWMFHLEHPEMTHPYRDGRLLVVSPDTVAPRRCVICNTDCCAFPAVRRISTLSAWYPLFASAGWNAHCADDLPIHIPFSICLRHRLEQYARLSLILGFSASNILLFTMFGAGIHVPRAIDFLVGAAPLPLMATFWMVQPTLRPRRVHGGLAWFSGCGSEFLDSLPELSDAIAVNDEPRRTLERLAA